MLYRPLGDGTVQWGKVKQYKGPKTIHATEKAIKCRWQQ